MSPRAWIALLWLDWRLLVNRVRTIRRNPRRLVPWLVFLVWLVPSWINRIFLGSHLKGALPGHELARLFAPVEPLIPGLAVLMLGVIVWRTSGRAPAAFQSPADARFVIGAGLDSRAVFAWLAVRTARRLIVTVALILVLAQVLYLPWLGVPGPRAFAVIIAVGAFGWIVFGAGMFAFNLRRAAPWLPVEGIGAALTLAGALAALLMLSHALGILTLPPALSSLAQALPPGGLLVAASAGDGWALAVLLLLGAGMTAAGIALAGDCYPELWETSSRVFAIRSAIRERGGTFGLVRPRPASGETSWRPQRATVRSSSGRGFPGGAATVFWKEWLALRRRRGGLRLQALLIFGAVALGILLGLAARRGSAMGLILSANVALLLILWSWVASVQLGRDLGSPLWWLSPEPLWRRLTAWTFARAMRFALPLIVFVEVAIASSGQDLWLLPIAPLPPVVLCWLMQAVGLGGYAVLPARTDYRLALMLRMLAVYVIAVPLAMAWVPGALVHSVVLMAALPMVIALCAGAGLIAFATWRIGGNGLAFAREERH